MVFYKKGNSIGSLTGISYAQNLYTRFGIELLIPVIESGLVYSYLYMRFSTFFQINILLLSIFSSIYSLFIYISSSYCHFTHIYCFS